MQCVVLNNATGMAQNIYAGSQLQVKHQAVADHSILPESRSIALGNLHVHSRTPRCLAGMAGSVMPCLRMP
jgi:hypothetical protein